MSGEQSCAVCNAAFVATKFTPGYATRTDGTKICYECAGKADKANMIATGKATLYLTADGGQWSISNWPGTLKIHCSMSPKKSRHNIAGSRYDVWFQGPDGATWHGVQYGDNTQLLHCKRTKA